MKKSYTILLTVFSSFILISNSANPPDGMTGAPGDSLCIECHMQTNTPLNGTISVEGFPASITPGQTYPLTVVNRNTAGDAVKGGFQMTILSAINTKAGEMTNASASSRITNTFGGRQYFEHNPAKNYPDSNVVKWTVDWTAPELAAGTTITWYAAGNIANGNFLNSGDRVVTANGNGTIVLSSDKDISKLDPAIFPNPGHDRINIILPDGSTGDGHAIFYSVQGSRIANAVMEQGNIAIPDISTGIYIIEIRHEDQTYVVRWSKI